MPATDITIVTVAFNSEGVLPAMLETVPDGVPVVIVDNASTDRAALEAIAADHGAELVRSETNLGFGGGCNLGAAQVRTEFILFLNPDAALEPGALDALLAARDACPEAAAFNPRLLDRTGAPAFRRKSRLLPRLRWWSGPPPREDCEVQVLSGAAIFVRKALFDRVGGFDERIFLYHEDDDLALRLAEHGPLRYAHEAVVRHLEGHGSPRSPEVARWKSYHMARSALYTMRKHHRPAAGLRLGLHAFGKFLSPAAWLSRRKRAQAVGFLSGLLSDPSTP